MTEHNPQPLRNPALRYHGGKFRLAPWILSHFPPHQVYVESFGGAAGVLLRKSRSYAEVYNDLDGNITNFWRVLRDPEQRAQLIEALTLTPYAREEFDLSWQDTDKPVERARRLAIRAQMGFGSAGAVKGSTGFRADVHREYGTCMEHWLRYPDAVAAAGARFAGVLIDNRPAVDVIRQFDSENTLHYVDPPYVHSTRKLRSKGGYRHEMVDGQHAELLDLLCNVRGMVVLSGYATPLYSERLAGWSTRTRRVQAAGGRGAVSREETLYLNPACIHALNHSLLPLYAHSIG